MKIMSKVKRLKKYFQKIDIQRGLHPPNAPIYLIKRLHSQAPRTTTLLIINLRGNLSHIFLISSYLNLTGRQLCQGPINTQRLIIEDVSAGADVIRETGVE